MILQECIVDIGGRQLYMIEAGHGKPTVVIDAGLGGNSTEWVEIIQQLSGEAFVCAYDRFGIEHGYLLRVSYLCSFSPLV